MNPENTAADLQDFIFRRLTETVSAQAIAVPVLFAFVVLFIIACLRQEKGIGTIAWGMSFLVFVPLFLICPPALYQTLAVEIAGAFDPLAWWGKLLVFLAVGGMAAILAHLLFDRWWATLLVGVAATSLAWPILLAKVFILAADKGEVANVLVRYGLAALIVGGFMKNLSWEIFPERFLSWGIGVLSMLCYVFWIWATSSLEVFTARAETAIYWTILPVFLLFLGQVFVSTLRAGIWWTFLVVAGVSLPYLFFAERLRLAFSWQVVLLPVLCLALFYVVMMYFKDARSIHPLWAIFLGLLRCFVYAILAVVFLLPALQSYETRVTYPKVVVLLDVSDSMLWKDRLLKPGEKDDRQTRQQQVIDFLTRKKIRVFEKGKEVERDAGMAWIDRLLEKSPLTIYRFGSRPDEVNVHKFGGGETSKPSKLAVTLKTLDGALLAGEFGPIDDDVLKSQKISLRLNYKSVGLKDADQKDVGFKDAGPKDVGLVSGDKVRNLLLEGPLGSPLSAHELGGDKTRPTLFAGNMGVRKLDFWRFGWQQFLHPSRLDIELTAEEQKAITDPEERRKEKERREDLLFDLQKGTDIPFSALRAAELEAGQQVQAIIIISDGRSNTSGTEKSLRDFLNRVNHPEHKIHVFTVGVGEYKQPVVIKIDELQAPQIVRPDDRFPVNVPVVGTADLRGQDFTVSLQAARFKPRGKNGYLGAALDNEGGGARITELVAAGPAQKAGLKKGDIVTAVALVAREKDVINLVGEIKPVDSDALQGFVEKQKPGDEINLKVQRGKDILDVKAIVGKDKDTPVRLPAKGGQFHGVGEFPQQVVDFEIDLMKIFIERETKLVGEYLKSRAITVDLIKAREADFMRFTLGKNDVKVRGLNVDDPKVTPEDIKAKFMEEYLEGEWDFAAIVPRHANESVDAENDADEHVSAPANVLVQNKKLRVLLFAGGPTRDYQFLRTLLARELQQQRLELSIYLQTAAKADNTDQEVPPERFLKHFPHRRGPDHATDKFSSINMYDLIIAIDPDWSELDANLPENAVTKTVMTADVSKLLDHWVSRENGSIIFVAGPVSTYQLARDAPELKEIKQMVPVVLSDYRLTPGGLGLGIDMKRPWPLHLTPAASAQDFLKLDQTGTSPIAGWDKFFWGEARKPSFKDSEPKNGFYYFYPVEKKRPAAAVLATFAGPEETKLKNGDEHPYLVAMPYGGGKTVFIGSSESYRLRGYKESFHEHFWLSLARYASSGTKEQKNFGRFVAGRKVPVGFVNIEAQIKEAILKPLGGIL